MNERPETVDPSSRSSDPLAPLFGAAGRRACLPEAEVEPYRAAARTAWRRHLRRRTARRGIAAAALAAGLLLVVGLTVRGRRPASPPSAPPPSAILGELLLRTGEVTVAGSGATPGLTPGSSLVTGGSGRAALRLAGGVSLRVDVESRVRFESATIVALERGAIYVDSDPRSPGTPIAVATPLGTVRHLGTQFEVRWLEARSGAEPAALRVTVREGVVEIGRRGRVVEVRAGDELTLCADGSIRREVATAQGPTWDWTQRAVPSFSIEGRTLATFLDWVSRETGLRRQPADPELERVLHETVLHGSIEGLTPEEALTEVLAGSDLRHHRSEQGLVLEPVAP
jgi:ferric-dicitrate binding protein FerR (iron transport regulator)